MNQSPENGSMPVSRGIQTQQKKPQKLGNVSLETKTARVGTDATIKSTIYNNKDSSGNLNPAKVEFYVDNNKVYTSEVESWSGAKTFSYDLPAASSNRTVKVRIIETTNNKVTELSTTLYGPSKKTYTIENVTGTIQVETPIYVIKTRTNETKYYEKISKVGEYENTRVRLSALEELSNSLNNLGYSIEDFILYLDDINNEGIDIKYNSYNSNSDSVKVMTIHKSKGLEYPICYFADLDHEFNLSDSNDMFITSDKYGLIVPTVNNDVSILKKLYKNDYIKEEIGEKIRLFYVALTRAREKMIVFLPKKDTIQLYKDENGVINKSNRLSFLKLSDFIYGIKDYLNMYFSEIDVSKIGLTKNYLFNKYIKNELKNNSEDFIVNEINIENDINVGEHFSKENYSIIDNKSYTINR